MCEIVAAEFCGTPSKRKNNFVTQNGSVVKLKNGRRHDYTFGHFFNEVFFPEGYPESVSQDYISYQIFDTIQAFCSSVNGTIATQSIMRGLGVGEEATTALAATLTWVLKDGVGMIGRIVFAWAQGSDLDCDLKRWRLRADFLNDIAMFLDVVSPNFGQYFVVIVCFSALLKSIVGIAGLGTRPAIIQHQARKNNIGDVAAKDSSQETLVNLAALLTSLLIMPTLYNSPLLSWIAFFFLAFVHIIANYYAVRSLCLETFNQARFHTATMTFFISGGNVVPSVPSVNLQEPIIFSLKRSWKIDLGCRIPRTNFFEDDLEFIKSLYGNNPFSIFLDRHNGRILVFLSQNATDSDALEAAFEAEMISYRLTHRKLASLILDKKHEAEILRQVRAESQQLYARFFKLATMEGWDCSRSYMGIKEWRVTWRIPQDTNVQTL